MNTLVRRNRMPTAVVVAIFSALGTILGSVLTFLALRYTARQAAQTQVSIQKSSAETAEVVSLRVEVSSLRDDWKDLQHELRDQATSYEMQLAEVRKLAFNEKSARERCESRLDKLERDYGLHSK